MPESSVLVADHRSSNRIMTKTHSSKQPRIANSKTRNCFEVAFYDMNHIKHPWKVSKHTVLRRHPSNLRQLEQFAQEEWVKIPAGCCRSLTESYRKKIVVIASKGCATKHWICWMQITFVIFKFFFWENYGFFLFWKGTSKICPWLYVFAWNKFTNVTGLIYLFSMRLLTQTQKSFCYTVYQNYYPLDIR